MRSIKTFHTATHSHWVGNGFPVSTLFSYDQNAADISPFLLLDYAGPMEFGPAQRARGVGSHPHRGFETVTLVYQGGVTHKDSAGNGGTIGPGDVQWMTAGAGIVHEEKHSAEFAKTGGTLEMVQLWVNLPAADKMVAPRYQDITANEIPSGALEHTNATYRVIAGEYQGLKGPAQTFSDLLVMDMVLPANELVEITLPRAWNVMVTVLSGTVQLNKETIARDASLAVYAQDHEAVLLEANNEARVLITAGAPIHEPVVGHGPFVMNSEAEIAQAIKDFQQGNFGEIPTSN